METVSLQGFDLIESYAALGEDGICIPLGVDHNVGEDEILDNSSDVLTDNSSVPQDVSIDPYEGMEFDSEEAAKIYYNAYARRMGFSIRISSFYRSRRDGKITSRHFVCAKEGFCINKDMNFGNQRKRRRTITREGCKAFMWVKRQSTGKWIVVKIHKEHNHALVPPDQVHYLRSHRHLSAPIDDVNDPIECQIDANVELDEGMEFESEEVARAYYKAYARRIGFKIRISKFYRSKRDGSVTSRHFVCSKEGFSVNRNINYDGNIKRHRAIRREGCKAYMWVKKQPSGRWVIVKIQKEHNHSLVSPSKVHCTRLNKNSSGPTKRMFDLYPIMTSIPHAILSISLEKPRGIDLDFIAQNYRNYVRTGPQKTLGKDAQFAMEYLTHKKAENPDFFYAIQVDSEDRMSNVFWVDPDSKMAYKYFGDVVIIDTTYQMNCGKVPVVAFTGVNNHGQPLLFGCALLPDQSESSFIWLFQTWIMAMSGCHPISIIADRNRVMQTALKLVFPKTRQCFNKWHIFREAEENLSLYSSEPDFQMEFHECINLTETMDEFESCWRSLLARYDLNENIWLQSVHSIRQQWVPVYLRDTFFAEICLTSREGNLCSCFEGIPNAETTFEVFKHYENVLDFVYEKEIEADFDSINATPILKTPSPMEKQASDLYTKFFFTKFQDELVETFVYSTEKIEYEGEISTYRVTKFGEDRSHTVMFNISEMRASCTCRMFESSGILCRHILSVFNITNVHILPSYYILKRWTRNAKSSILLEDCDVQNCFMETSTLRYDNLCQEAVKFAVEGSSFIDSYNVALSSLGEALEKVLSSKKNIPKLSCANTQANNNDSEDHTRKLSSVPFLMWPKRDDATEQFCPSITGASSSYSDLNLAVLPHLKSMTWTMENQKLKATNRAAIISMKLQHHVQTKMEAEVKFQLSRECLADTLRSMASINDQLSTPCSRVAVINLKLPEDTKRSSGETDLKFQVSKDTLEAMLRSMVYINEQLLKGLPPCQQLIKKQQ